MFKGGPWPTHYYAQESGYEDDRQHEGSMACINLTSTYLLYMRARSVGVCLRKGCERFDDLGFAAILCGGNRFINSTTGIRTSLAHPFHVLYL